MDEPHTQGNIHPPFPSIGRPSPLPSYDDDVIILPGRIKAIRLCDPAIIAAMILLPVCLHPSKHSSFSLLFSVSFFFFFLFSFIYQWFISVSHVAVNLPLFAIHLLCFNIQFSWCFLSLLHFFHPLFPC